MYFGIRFMVIQAGREVGYLAEIEALASALIWFSASISDGVIERRYAYALSDNSVASSKRPSFTNRDIFLYSLVRLQPLAFKHKIQILESKKKPLIARLFEYQEFSENESEQVKNQFPHIEELFQQSNTFENQINLNREKRLRRDRNLKQKLNNLFEHSDF